MPEIDQVLRHAKGRLVTESLHVDGLKPASGPMMTVDAALPEFTGRRRPPVPATDRRKKNAIDPTRDQVLQMVSSRSG